MDGEKGKEFASVVAALQAALGRDDEAGGNEKAVAEDLSRRISALELSSEANEGREEVVSALRRQMASLQKKKACARIFFLISKNLALSYIYEMFTAAQIEVLSYTLTWVNLISEMRRGVQQISLICSMRH